jgi:hypothetical protein
MRIGRLLVLVPLVAVAAGLVGCGGDDLVPSLPADSTVAPVKSPWPETANQTASPSAL